MKKIWAIFLCALLILPLSGCDSLISSIEDSLSSSGGSGDEFDYEDDAIRVEEDTVYYNDYLDISYKLQEGYYIYDIDKNNLSTREGEPGYDQMNIIADDGWEYIELISAANKRHSDNNDHVGFYLYAERSDIFDTVKAYTDDYADYLTTKTDGHPYVLLSSGTEDIGGVVFEMRTYEVQQPDRPFEELILTCDLGDGYYLSVSVSYWPENKAGMENYVDSLSDNLMIA